MVKLDREQVVRRLMNHIAIRLKLPKKMPPVLGVGAFLKNTLCLIQGDEAWISADNGSLDNAEAIETFERRAHALLSMAKDVPVAVAHDLHPDFASTRFALALCQQSFPPPPAKSRDLLSVVQDFASPPSRGEVPISVPIQHHHAHVATIMAEHGLNEPVLGLALDGFGLGPNNESWGGELLRVDACGHERLGHLRPLPQPGGDIAARQTWRMGAAALWAIGRGNEIAGRYREFPNAGVLASMMERGLNSPMTSSAGRLFDAACGLLGVKPVAAFEGEAPMALEGMVRETKVDPEGWKIISENDCGAPPHPRIKSGAGSSPPPQGEREFACAQLDLRPLLAKLADCKAQEGAELFHGTLIEALADWAGKAAEITGIRKVALGGGCFYNKVLREELSQRMMAMNLTPLLPKLLPAGDPAISLGQAWAAAMMIEKG